MLETEISRLVIAFSTQIVALVETSTRERIAAVFAGAFSTTRRGPGRPRKNLLGAGPVAIALPLRKKPPKQLCPVPGCKNVAAPVYGMVCAEHENVPKAKIKEYRAARKAAKAAAKGRAKPATRRKAKRQANAPRRARRKATRARKVAAKPATQAAPASETKSE